MRVVILGAGRRGIRLAKYLIDEKKDVTLIEADVDRCNQATAKLDCLAIQGSGTNPKILKEAGLENADLFIALSDSDEVNLVSCAMVGALFKSPRTVAAIRSMSYTGSELNMRLLGIDFIVNPFEEVSKFIFDIIQSGVFLDSSTFPHTPFVLCTVPISKDSFVAGKKVSEIRSTSRIEFVVSGIQRGQKSFLPAGKDVIQAGDNIAIVAQKSELADILEQLDAKLSRPKSIVFVGAGRITNYLLTHFGKTDKEHFTIIEKDEEKCKSLAKKFPIPLIIKGDITEEAIWESENLKSYDLLISLTDNDELNIITSSYAKRMGISHAIALIKSNPNYAALARHFDIDTVVSMTETTVDTLLRYVRGENIASIHSIFDGSIEVSEYALKEGNCAVIGKKIKDLPLAGNVVITGITDKNGKSLIPNGNYQFVDGDNILVAVPHGHIDIAQGLFT